VSRAADIARGVATSLTAGVPALRGLLRGVRERLQVAHHALGTVAPVVIRPRTVNVTVALTARCNQRCAGCLYERGFMPGAALSREVLDDLVDDAALLGVRSLRLYGGEPLLHPDLAHVVERAAAAGLDPYVTTNGVLLDERIDELVAAGLRHLTFGFYGVGKAYDEYVERPGNYARLERGIAAVRERHGDRVRMRMNWLLMRPTCSVDAADQALAFARRYRTPIQVDLVHYSLPYFTEGADRQLAFAAADRPAIERVVERLLQCKSEEPELVENSEIGLRSIPDWLLRGAAMRVPCDKYRMVWVGADGTVQLCYVTFRLGNLHEHRLRELLYTEAHHCAARDAFALKCPNCHCGYDERTRKHLPTRLAYGRAT
jgi:MoaA/NifB/PqqE/SkfB family radical SAM enzyme